MTDTRHDAPTLEDVRAGFMLEQKMAQQRGKSLRTMRLERQRGEGPPYVKDGRQILYPIAGYREWLAANLRRPVRACA